MKEHNEWVSEKWENVEVRYRVRKIRKPLSTNIILNHMGLTLKRYLDELQNCWA
jgi:hypothetical protein